MVRKVGKLLILSQCLHGSYCWYRVYARLLLLLLLLCVAGVVVVVVCCRCCCCHRRCVDAVTLERLGGLSFSRYIDV